MPTLNIEMTEQEIRRNAKRTLGSYQTHNTMVMYSATELNSLIESAKEWVAANPEPFGVQVALTDDQKADFLAGMMAAEEEVVEQVRARLRELCDA